MKRIVVLISGNGSNLQALLDNIHGKGDAEIVLVLSNRKAAYGLERARQMNVPTAVMTLKAYRDEGKTRDDYDAALAEAVLHQQPDLVVLAGWMHILSTVFLQRLRGRVINLHPALPGMFDGANAIHRQCFICFR